MKDSTIEPLYQPTQLLKSLYLSERLGLTVLLKMDCALPSGSFKIRGMSHLIQTCIKQNYTSFVASSGGNAGIAATTVCAKLKMPLHVFLPVTTPKKIIDKLKLIYPADPKNPEKLPGVQITQSGANWNEADKLAREKVETSTEKIKYISPFDDPLLWEGHSSIITEMKNEMDKKDSEFNIPDLVICSVGGGGLFNGIRQGLINNYGESIGNQIPVLAVETIGCHSLNEAVKRNEKGFRLNEISSKATSLGSLYASDQTFDLYTSSNSFSTLVSDQQCFDSMKEFSRNERVLIEPACAASIAAIDSAEKFNEIRKNWQNSHFEGKAGLSDDMKVIVIEVCGGNITEPYYEL